MSIPAQQLIADQPRKDDTPYSIHLAPTGSEFFALGSAVELDVFGGTFGLDPDQIAHHYSRYDSASDFVLLVDRNEAVVAGAVRLVRWTDLGLPTFVEAKKYPEWDRSMADAYRHHGWEEPPTRIFDVATAGLMAPYRGNGIAHVALTYGSFELSLRAGCLRWVALIDVGVMKAMAKLGLNWEPVCDMPAREHEGSPATIPVTVGVKEASMTAMVGFQGPGDASPGISDVVSLSTDRLTMDLRTPL